MISIGGGSIRLWGLLDDIELNNLEPEEVDEFNKKQLAAQSLKNVAANS